MPNNLKIPESAKVLEQIDAKKAITVIIGVSVGALLFLIWLIYFNEGVETTLPFVAKLPAVNATLNSLSAIFLIFGLREIKKKNFQMHMKYMISAFVTSSLFLVSYIIYHHFQGDTHFMGEGFVRPVYFFILISHIILSAFVVPLALTSFFFSFSGKFKIHRKVSKFTFPIWLYVSVTGVVIFAMLKVFG